MQWVWHETNACSGCVKNLGSHTLLQLFILILKRRQYLFHYKVYRSGTPMPTVAGTRGQITIMWDALYIDMTVRGDPFDIIFILFYIRYRYLIVHDIL